MPMIRVHIRFFAGHRDIVGQPEMTLVLEPGTTVGMLWERLSSEHPRLRGYTGRLLYAVNQQFSDLATELRDGDEVAYIPPVSGGTDANIPDSSAPASYVDIAPFVITTAPLDPMPLIRYVQTAGDGAIVTFAGVVRDHFAGRATAYLIYEAYAEMVVPVLQQLADEARSRWPIGRIAVHHRVGRLEIGETAVLVVVAAPHRQAAFAASEYIMDRIKEVAPIWKREHWADGQHEWRE